MALLYQLCQTFHDGTLTHTRFADKYRVVLLAAAQYLYYTLYLALTTHAWVQLTLGSSLCQVGAETVENRSLRVLFLLRGSGALLIVAGTLATAGLLVFLLFLVGQTYTVAHVVALRSKQSVKCVVVCHVVYF